MLLQPGECWSCSFPFSPSPLHRIPPHLALRATITFPSPGSGLPLSCHRSLAITTLDLCSLHWTPAATATAHAHLVAEATFSASAVELRQRLRVPAVLGLVGSRCDVLWGGELLCSLRVAGAAEPQGGGADHQVEVEVLGGGSHACSWIVEAVAAVCT